MRIVTIICGSNPERNNQPSVHPSKEQSDGAKAEQ